MSRLAIEIEELTKTYRGGVEALRGVSFAVNPGEIFGLLGPNGAGKSTTVRILATLSEPTGGIARVCGTGVTEDPAEVRRRIGYVAQHSGVSTMATGRENLVLQGHLFRMPGREVRRRADELLEFMGLSDASNRLVRTYSGGMRRRLDIAMGLMHRPEVLFLDEPTAGLDPESRSALWEEISRLSYEEGLTILLTTHYLEEADHLAHRLAVIDEGKVVESGTPDELKSALQGDTVSVEVETEEHANKGVATLEQLDGVNNVLVEDKTLHARVRDGARAVPAVLAVLEKSGMTAGSVTLSRPSLDDVYLKATGRSFHRAETEAAVTGSREEHPA